MKRAFTLIELLIVVAIIAILAAIAVPNFLEAQTRAKVSRVKSDLRSVSTGIQSYAVDNNNYPPDEPTPQYRLSDVYRLTTPVAYLSSISLSDPFVVGKINGNIQGYQYFNFQVTWGPAAGATVQERKRSIMLKSYGPDRQDGGAEWLIFGISQNRGGWVGINRVYDPTNGTVSFGDVVRFVGDTNGMAEQPN